MFIHARINNRTKKGVGAYNTSLLVYCRLADFGQGAVTEKSKCVKDGFLAPTEFQGLLLM